ncbi:hypothetical protein MNBD_IGNAVI01-1448 [hydrothermal vent metagenome]|uniref:DUF4296 domain-containing protein n=1 Tax=hydrothermal vent metagenome TaxID=652676 RepID=A0A3B1CI12_9ZZZZ
MKIFLIFLIGSIFFINGCSSEDKVDKDKIAHLYVDILVTQETYKYNIDSLKIAVDSLYKEYQLTEQQYKSSLEKFKYDEQSWTEFFKLAEVYLDTLKAQENRRIAEKKKEEKELKLNK